MSVMTDKDVTLRYNSVISTYMNRGYIISPFTHGGTYLSTTNHVDLIKPNDNSHILRIWLLDDYHSINNKYCRHINVVHIRVKSYNKNDGFDGNISNGQQLWPSNGQVLYEEMFYMFKTCKSGKSVYAYNLDEALSYIKLSDSRYDRRYTENYININKEMSIDKLTPKFIDQIMSRITSLRGFKRATSRCIKSVKLSKDYSNKIMATVKYEFNGKLGYINLH